MKTPIVEILSQGEEVLTGQVVDTNSAWLSEQLVALGFRVARHVTVGDRLEDLILAFKEMTNRSDLCLCTGGLGPTSDDLTAMAVADAFECPLAEDSIALKQIEQYFSQRQKDMPAINRKQALLPEGAIRLDNNWGTAPGFILHVNQCWLVCVPGVPYEMRKLFSVRIVPFLSREFVQNPWQLVVIRTVNIGESDIQQRIQKICLPESVTLSYRAELWENQTKLLFPPDFQYQQKQNLVDQYVRAIGKSVISVDGFEQDGGSLVDVLDRLLRERAGKVYLIETISAGKIAARCHAANWINHAEIIFKTEQLLNLYGTDCTQLCAPEQLLLAARKMAKQACENNQSDYSLVQLWKIRNDLDDLDDGIIPIVTIAYARNGQFTKREDELSGSLIRRQTRAAVIGLDVLRQFLIDVV